MTLRQPVGAPPPATHRRSQWSTKRPNAAFALCAAAARESSSRPSDVALENRAVRRVARPERVPLAEDAFRAPRPPVFGFGGKSIRAGKCGEAADVTDTSAAAAAPRPRSPSETTDHGTPFCLGKIRAEPNGSAPATERPLDLPIGLALRDVAALVEPLLALPQRELDLCPPVLEVSRVGTSVKPRSRTFPISDSISLRCRSSFRSRSGSWLLTLPWRTRRCARRRASLPVAHVRVRLLQRRAALAQRLDLGAGQHDAGLVPLEQVVVVPRAAVLCDQLLRHAATLAQPLEPSGEADHVLLRRLRRDDRDRRRALDDHEQADAVGEERRRTPVDLERLRLGGATRGAGRSAWPNVQTSVWP